jgi:hypothetical protein
MIYGYSTCKHFVASSTAIVNPNTNSRSKCIQVLKKTNLKKYSDFEKYGSLPQVRKIGQHT